MGARCPRCNTAMIKIELEVQERRVTMRSCSSCSRRWWHTDGDPVDVTDVLSLAARR